MRRTLSAAALALVSPVLLVGCGAASNSSSKPPVAGRDFSARDVRGETVRLSDHLGREVVLLDFFSTVCEPCKAEFPHLRALYDARRAEGLIVIAVAMDGPETVADVPSFVRRFGLSFPTITDDDSHIARVWNPKKSMPFSVLYGRDGKVVSVREGYTPGDEKLLDGDVDRALHGPSGR